MGSCHFGWQVAIIFGIERSIVRAWVWSIKWRNCCRCFLLVITWSKKIVDSCYAFMASLNWQSEMYKMADYWLPTIEPYHWVAAFMVYTNHYDISQCHGYNWWIQYPDTGYLWTLWCIFSIHLVFSVLVNVTPAYKGVILTLEVNIMDWLTVDYSICNC